MDPSAEDPDRSDRAASSELEAITRWRRSLDAGDDPGPPPIPLPGLLRLERGRRLARDLEQSLGFDHPPVPASAQFPLSALLVTRPAAPSVTVWGPAAETPAAFERQPILSIRDGATPVLAFRAWEIAGGRLRGVRVAWPVPTVEARCLDPGRWTFTGAADVPHTDGSCGPPPCGIRAAKTAAGALEAVVGREPLALGIVALAGKVVEHERGYRAAAATAVGMLVVSRGEAMRFDGFEVDELFAAPDAAVAAARSRAGRLPPPGPKRHAFIVERLEAIMSTFTGRWAGGEPG
ncbi:MAG: hypothetical protein FJW79_10985 [Actinobacteria bacterium]|nr:hypothetical protein [Actinomycetota bacterium]